MRGGGVVYVSVVEMAVLSRACFYDFVACGDGRYGGVFATFA
jgi:hypothetical protein